MELKKLIIKIIIKITVFIIISSVMLYFINLPTLTNSIALTQMEISDESYLFYNAFSNIKHFIYLVYGMITAFFAVNIILNIYNYIKNRIKEKEKN